MALPLDSKTSNGLTLLYFDDLIKHYEGREMKSWKKGALIGSAVWLAVVAVLGVIGNNAAYIVVFLMPDFFVIGAVIGYILGRIQLKSGSS